MELRCDSRILHGIVDEDIIEVTCKSRWCGKRPGVVVLHRFQISTGQLIETKRFREPKEETNGPADQGTAVRSA